MEKREPTQTNKINKKKNFFKIHIKLFKTKLISKYIFYKEMAGYLIFTKIYNAKVYIKYRYIILPLFFKIKF